MMLGYRQSHGYTLDGHGYINMPGQEHATSMRKFTISLILLWFYFMKYGGAITKNIMEAWTLQNTR